MKTSLGVPIKLFCSYSHNDTEIKDQLFSHLSLLRKQGIIDLWHDREITAGEEWATAIDEHLGTARVILLLVSSDFLASDYCYGVEMTRALSRHESAQAQVIPVILRPVDWDSAPFAHLNCLPTNGKPVTSWINRDEAFADVARGIRRTIFVQSVEGFERLEAHLQDERYSGRLFDELSDVEGHADRRSTRFGRRSLGIPPSTVEEPAWGNVVVDDVIKSRDRKTDLLLLDVRVRNAGSEVANLTRANLRILYEKFMPTLGVYEPSATYDLKITGPNNVVGIAHVLQPGEVDRFILRIETSHDYVRLARIEIRYNRDSVSLSDIFWL